MCPECYKPLTCGNTKGRNKHYWYYECTTHRKSYSVEVAHSKFKEILSEISFSDTQIEYLKESVKDKLIKKRKENKDLLPDFTVRRTAALHKMENLEEKYILGNIDDTTYSKWKNKLNAELELLEGQIKSTESKNKLENLEKVTTRFWLK